MHVQNHVLEHQRHSANLKQHDVNYQRHNAQIQELTEKVESLAASVVVPEQCKIRNQGAGTGGASPSTNSDVLLQVWPQSLKERSRSLVEGCGVDGGSPSTSLDASVQASLRSLEERTRSLEKRTSEALVSSTLRPNWEQKLQDLQDEVHKLTRVSDGEQLRQSFEARMQQVFGELRQQLNAVDGQLKDVSMQRDDHGMQLSDLKSSFQ